MVSLNQAALLYSDPVGQVSLYSLILEVLHNHKCSKIPTVKQTGITRNVIKGIK